MGRLEDLQPGARVQGIADGSEVTVVSLQWYGSDALELTYKLPTGRVGNELLYRTDEPRLEIGAAAQAWSFDANGEVFRLTAEAHRIHLAHLFDPLLAVHTSLVDPLPHQITAVYEAMLQRQPLRFLLADDPGAGKTIMAGLLIKELIARGDLQRCLVVCPGSLAEQWQDELYNRFHLPFEILTSEGLESARTGNWFLEHDLVIARLDKLSRNEDLREKLNAEGAEWDLVVCDEAHKMSASFFGGEIKYTQRYQLGQLLSSLTRHFLLMTATPHNGKETDFQLFMGLIDPDQFEGRFRDGVHTTDVSHLMRRMVKEKLLTFEGKRLFPERMAYTVPFKLSAKEMELYQAVTAYVRDEFNRADQLENEKRTRAIGFALTSLQRRLASSPEAIYQSLRRRKERLGGRLEELERFQRTGSFDVATLPTSLADLIEDPEDLDEAPDEEVEAAEQVVMDQATAARTVGELRIEISTLTRLEALATGVHKSGEDTKWRELAEVLEKIFTSAAIASRVAEPSPDGQLPPPTPSPRQKLVIFTEHRDTLYYLHKRIATLLGRPDTIVCIHGGMAREARLEVQDRFRNDPEVTVLLATDAAGEGINLQRAHLMVNYDLPWNPNRLEQRFGRIHRIGQTEVCHLWNLVAQETREGEVYHLLLQKLQDAREALGGQVFDVLGKVEFEGKPLRELLLEAVRYGDLPEVRAKLIERVADAVDHDRIRDLFEDHAIVQDVMDTSRVRRIREDMDRADARRLQPHFIKRFFREAFQHLGGTMREREPDHFQVTHVPATIRQRRLPGRGTVGPRYERIVFDKTLRSPKVEFVSPGHPLLDATLEVTLERNRDVLRRGTVLVDENDLGTEPRVLSFLEHVLQDAGTAKNGERRVVSKQMLYVETTASGTTRALHYAPYLDYRPLAADDPSQAGILALPDCARLGSSIESTAMAYAIAHVVPAHRKEVEEHRLALIAKTRAAVKARLTKEIHHWDRRAEELRAQEQAGKGTRLNSAEARKKADMLQERLKRRLAELDQEAKISALPPSVAGAALVIPMGLLAKLRPEKYEIDRAEVDRQKVAATARAIVMEQERALGFEPVDRELEKLGYDIESRDPRSGLLRFIEVKGRAKGAETVTVTCNEILYSFNKPDQFILAIVELDGDRHATYYIRRPFDREPDPKAASVNYRLSDLLLMAQVSA